MKKRKQRENDKAKITPERCEAEFAMTLSCTQFRTVENWNYCNWQASSYFRKRKVAETDKYRESVKKVRITTSKTRFLKAAIRKKDDCCI